MSFLFSEQTATLLFTVISGVFVYILCELFTEFILRPVQEYKKLKAKVAKILILYANRYCNPYNRNNDGDCAVWKAGESTIREIAAEVSAFAETKPPQIFVFLSIPRKKKLKNAASALIGISNSFFKNSTDLIDSEIENWKKTIKKEMRI